MCQIHSYSSATKLPPFMTPGPTQPVVEQEPVGEAPQDVVLHWNPQDPSVMKPGTLTLAVTRQGNNIMTDMVRSRDQLEPVDGKYVFAGNDSLNAKSSAFASVANTVNEFKKRFGDFGWSFKTQHLGVHGDGGKFLNAFYRRENQAVIFYHSPDQVNKNMVYSGGSADIASHESGHAILDGIRPEYFNCVTNEPRAFHESFGDCLAMHMALLQPSIVDLVMQQTGGDLSKPNAAANIAEELGMAVNHEGGKTGGDYLRTSLHDLKWADPATLKSEKGGPNEVGWGRHSFGRVWSGAHYEFLTTVAAHKRAEGMEPREALVAANEEVFQRLADMLKEAPQGDFTYRDMALALMTSEEKHHGGQYLNEIKDVFTRRQILQEGDGPKPFMSLSQEEPYNLEVRLDGSFGTYSGAKLEVPFDPSGNRSEDEMAVSTKGSIRQLIANNQLRYNDPGYQMKFPQDQLNPQGEPYLAAVHWENGEMVIRPLSWTVCHSH